ncbi:hypothetical protein TVAG_071120 [Trichomonas vaginalis G3]|uniref:Uncharacterized protein n=1 Tax=Trichomonas vaginalis (strain ATCC PRA-98 / G3) TaxID=412133 RepID=A2D815_TRIV3|nr:protein ubiquitination [Trichomonas vaginalis G3]EAY23448.1 hypothetical protein TVAG_071120 [Trichomonas vaginalis G3]KAI5493861.1 protein ubiquitination [Trichomonas vaginalis G3]|eukprot:XP_001584434.1 hypothetical protein [Trichomonas vaginalis G3]
MITSELDLLPDQILGRNKNDIAMDFIVSILSSNSLLLKREDDMCNFVISYCKTLSELEKLLPMIQFEYCTNKTVSDFINKYSSLMHPNSECEIPEHAESNEYQDESQFFSQIFTNSLVGFCIFKMLVTFLLPK